MNDEKTWDDVDFPFWFKYEVYNDTWDLGRNAQYAMDLSDDEMPEIGKYMVFTVWFKVVESREIKGPYTDKNGDRL